MKKTRKKAPTLSELGDPPENLILVEGVETALRSRSVAGIVGRVRSPWVKLGPGTSVGVIEEAVAPGWSGDDRVSLHLVEDAPAPGWGVLQDFARDVRVLLVEFTGDVPKDSPLGRLADKIPKGRRFCFPAGKPWEARARSVQFAKSEFAQLGVRDEGAAEALADAGLVDLGRLGMECQKVAWYCAAQGRRAANADDVRAVDPLGGRSEVEDFVAALAARDLPQIARALSGMRRASRTPPVARVAAVVSRCGYQWLCAATHKGTDQEVGEAVGAHPFVVKIRVRPAATRWGVAGSRALIEVAARADRALRSGARAPWAVLCAGVLQAAARGGVLGATPPR